MHNLKITQVILSEVNIIYSDYQKNQFKEWKLGSKMKTKIEELFKKYDVDDPRLETSLFYGYNKESFCELIDLLNKKISEYEIIEKTQFITDSEIDDIITKEIDRSRGDFKFMYGRINDKDRLMYREICRGVLELNTQKQK